MIIDSETHPLVVSKNNGAVEDHSDNLLRQMDSLGVEKACIMPSPLPDCDVAFKRVEELAKRHPTRFVAFCRFSYELDKLKYQGGQEAAESIANIFQRSQWVKGVGEMAFHELGETDPNQIVKTLGPVLDLLAKYKYPIEFHVAPPLVAKPLRSVDPVLIDDIAIEYPEVPILMNHSGGVFPPYCDTARIVARKNENVYLTTSEPVASVDNEVFEAWKKLLCRFVGDSRIGPERVIFGSDWRGKTWPKCIETSLSIIRGAGLKDEEKELILGGNMKRLLRQ